jgi:hypothetical protein
MPSISTRPPPARSSGVNKRIVSSSPIGGGVPIVMSSWPATGGLRFETIVTGDSSTLGCEAGRSIHAPSPTTIAAAAAAGMNRMRPRDGSPAAFAPAASIFALIAVRIASKSISGSMRLVRSRLVSEACCCTSSSASVISIKARSSMACCFASSASASAWVMRNSSCSCVIDTLATIPAAACGPGTHAILRLRPSSPVLRLLVSEAFLRS